MKKALLIILDGLGLRPDTEGNAFKLANTPYLDKLLQEQPNATLRTDGAFVGLPEGQMGNSEVGHLTIGAGRVIEQPLVRIARQLREKSAEILQYFQSKKNIHIIGLWSDGGVHSHIDHLKALIDIFALAHEKEIYLHAISDGRDTDPSGGAAYFQTIEEYIKGKANIKIATLIGRYYAMDRDKRAERTDLAYKLLFKQLESLPPLFNALVFSYERGITDEFIEPHASQDFPGIKPGDGVLFFNFRSDRCRQLYERLSETIGENSIMTMTQYHEDYKASVISDRESVTQYLGEVLKDYPQFRIAETEKFPHVTYFFNGLNDTQLPLEERFLLPSPKEVATYDLKPEMSLPQVKEATVKALADNRYKWGVVNFANCDMVGHTGNLDATIMAVEAVDSHLREVVSAAVEHDYAVLIIADHGNAELMIEGGKKHTAHTTNPVPVILVNFPAKALKNGGLSDVSPSILDIMGIGKPELMTGNSLIIHQ